MSKKRSADMQKLDAFGIEMTAFAERYGVLFVLRKRDKSDMLEEAWRRNESIELIISERRREAIVMLVGIDKRVPEDHRYIPTLH